MEQKATSPVKVPEKSSITTVSASLTQDLREQTYIDLQGSKKAIPQQTHSNNGLALQKLDPAQGAIPKTNLNKVTSGSTLTLFDEARDIVENVVSENLIKPAMQVFADVTKEETNSSTKSKGKSKLTMLKNSIAKSLHFGKKTQGSLTAKEKESKPEAAPTDK